MGLKRYWTLLDVIGRYWTLLDVTGGSLGVVSTHNCPIWSKSRGQPEQTQTGKHFFYQRERRLGEKGGKIRLTPNGSTAAPKLFSFPVLFARALWNRLDPGHL